MIRPAQVPSVGVPARDQRAQRLGQPLALDAERHRRRLAAGHHEPVEPVEVGRRAHLARVRAETFAARARAPRSRPVGRERRSAAPGYQPRFCNRPPALSMSSMPMPVIGAPRSRDAAATRAASSKCVVASTTAAAVRSGSSDLKIPEPTKTPSAPRRHHQRRVGRGGDPAGGEHHDRELALLGHVADEVERRLQLLGGRRQLHRVERGQTADLATDRAQVANRLDDVARAGLALRADHGRALARCAAAPRRGWWRRRRTAP